MIFPFTEEISLSWEKSQNWNFKGYTARNSNWNWHYDRHWFWISIGQINNWK